MEPMCISFIAFFFCNKKSVEL